jgi:hypothetical protein
MSHGRRCLSGMENDGLTNKGAVSILVLVRVAPTNAQGQ